ncbi:MAG: TetR/AcrR family transcriptional regulator [Gammaproteobacteria bacterium]
MTYLRVVTTLTRPKGGEGVRYDPMPESTLIVTSSSRSERRRLRNQDALVVAARTLFAERGFEATTIADIADAADLGFGTFYSYFHDKEAVLEAVLDVGRAEFDALLTSATADGSTAAEALADLSGGFIRGVRRNRDLLTLMWEVATRKMATRRPLSMERAGHEHSLPVLLGSAIERIVAAGMASGEFAPGDVRVVSGLLAAAHMYWLSPDGRQIDEDTAIRTLCEFELRALGK